MGGPTLLNLEPMRVRDTDQCPSPHLLDFEGWVMNGWKQAVQQMAQRRATMGSQLGPVPLREVKSALCAPTLQSCRQNH